MPEIGLVCVNEKPPSAPLSSKLIFHPKSPACASSLTSLWMLCSDLSILYYTPPDVLGSIFNTFALILMHVMGLFCASSTSFVNVVNYNSSQCEQFSEI